MERIIDQITHETNYLLFIHIQDLQTKFGCYTDTVQTKLKPSDLIKWEVWRYIIPEEFTVGLI